MLVSKSIKAKPYDRSRRYNTGPDRRLVVSSPYLVALANGDDDGVGADVELAGYWAVVARDSLSTDRRWAVAEAAVEAEVAARATPTSLAHGSDAPFATGYRAAAVAAA